MQLKAQPKLGRRKIAPAPPPPLRCCWYAKRCYRSSARLRRGRPAGWCWIYHGGVGGGRRGVKASYDEGSVTFSPTDTTGPRLPPFLPFHPLALPPSWSSPFSLLLPSPPTVSSSTVQDLSQSKTFLQPQHTHTTTHFTDTGHLEAGLR